MAPVEAEHPPTARFSLQKKMSTYFIFCLDQCPAVHGWRNSLRLKLNRTEHYTDKILAHLMMVLILHNRTHHLCNILTLNSPSTEPEAAVGLWMGIGDKPERRRLLLGNSRGLNMAPQNGETEEQLCLRPVGQDQPSTEPSAGTWQQLQWRASQEKHTLGSHRLLETMWQCHLPAGAAGTFRMHQMLRTSRDVNGSGEKSMQKVTPKISSTEWQSNLRGFPWASTNSLSSPQEKLPTGHLAKGKEGLQRSPLLSRKLLTLPQWVQQSE